MKRLDLEAKLLRFAADFIQRRQPVVNVERSILETLRHDRAGALLEFENEMFVCAARASVIHVFREMEEQNVAQKIKDRFFDSRVASFGRRHRAINHRAIFVVYRTPGAR